MQAIISSLVIIHFDQLLQPNLRIFLKGTRSWVDVSASYLTKLFIHHYYHEVIVIWGEAKNLSKNAQNRRSGEKSNCLFETCKKFRCHMGVIYMQHQLPWPWIKFIHIHHPNMHFHTENVCCVVVLIDDILILQTKNHIGIIPTHILQYISYLSLNCLV